MEQPEYNQLFYERYSDVTSKAAIENHKFRVYPTFRFQRKIFGKWEAEVTWKPLLIVGEWKNGERDFISGGLCLCFEKGQEKSRSESLKRNVFDKYRAI